MENLTKLGIKFPGIIENILAIKKEKLDREKWLYKIDCKINNVNKKISKINILNIFILEMIKYNKYFEKYYK